MGLAAWAVQGVRNVWLASLGVFAVAQEAGAQVFDALVEEGKSWEQARREQTDTRQRQVKTLVEQGAETVEAVEKRVRTEVDDALRQVGVPRRSDLDALRGRVNDLAQKLDHLSQVVEVEPRDPDT